VIDCKKEKIFTKFNGESYEFNFSKFARTSFENDTPNENFRVEQLASIALAPNNSLQQFMDDHESNVFSKEREEIDDILLRQPPLISTNNIATGMVRGGRKRRFRSSKICFPLT
jgi:hypothetical protein